MISWFAAASSRRAARFLAAWIPALVLATLPLAAPAQTAYPAGQPLISGAPMDGWKLNGANAGATLVSATGPGFTQAWQIATKADSSPSYAIEWRTPIVRDVAKDDVALLRFYARATETSDESGAAYLRLVVQKASADWDKSTTMTFSLTKDWQEFLVPFAFIANYPANGSEVSFGFGFKKQTVQLGGFDFVYYGKTVTLASLPRTRITYVGSEPGAAWRTAALARIENIRKSDFTVNVVDAAGAPVPGATVRVAQTRSAFEFGSALQFSRIVTDTKDNLTYRQKVLELFNACSPENDLKWPSWDGDAGATYSQDQTLRALGWLTHHGLHVRGHNLVWPSWGHLPKAIVALRGTARESEIPALTLAHIDDIVGQTRSYLEEWDVLNEPYSNHDLMDLFGPQIQVDWFKEARKAHPTAALYLNDYGNHDASLDPAHVAAFESTARYLKSQGAPITGLGLQAHISGTPSPLTNVLNVLDRYAALGLSIRITEFDVNTDDEQLQADYTRDFMIAAYSHPSVVGFQMWGFWEGAHWIPKAALYRTDWSEKPNLQAYKSLVLDQWRTRANGVTDAQGNWRGRGFHGDYVVTVEVGGKTYQQTFSLRPGEPAPTIRVPLAAPRLANLSTRARSGSGDQTLIPGFTVAGSSSKRVLVRGVSQGLAPYGITGTLARMELALKRAPEGTLLASNQRWDAGTAAETAALETAATQVGAFPLSRGTGDCALIATLAPGSYTAPVTTSDGQTGPALVEAYDLDASPASRLSNLSTRASVGPGQDIAIPGIVVQGENARTFLVRAVGPGLAGFGLSGTLAKPSLVVMQGATAVAANTGWEVSPDPAAITSAAQRAGAFALKPGTPDAALIVTLGAGAYTIQVAGTDGGSGVVLVEVYDLGT